MIQKMIVDYLFNEENKKKLIEEMNKAIDIPFIGEKTEAKVLDAVWDSVEEVLKNAILKSK
jgi:hypothetical protein